MEFIEQCIRDKYDQRSDEPVPTPKIPHTAAKCPEEKTRQYPIFSEMGRFSNQKVDPVESGRMKVNIEAGQNRFQIRPCIIP